MAVVAAENKMSKLIGLKEAALVTLKTTVTEEPAAAQYEDGLVTVTAETWALAMEAKPKRINRNARNFFM